MTKLRDVLAYFTYHQVDGKLALAGSIKFIWNEFLIRDGLEQLIKMHIHFCVAESFDRITNQKRPYNFIF